MPPSHQPSGQMRRHQSYKAHTAHSRNASCRNRQPIKKKNPDVRIVINAISLETVKEAMEAMEEGLLADPEIIQLNVAKSKKLGRYHMMTGLNPIYIISDGGDTE